MRKELLVNATPPETRVALTEDGRVVEVLHERRGRQSLVGNVYLGRVHRVLPGMQAAFVSIGLDRDAFLYVEDAAPPAEIEFGEEAPDPAVGGPAGRSDARRIDDLVKEGQEIVVQVSKDPVASKGPRVSTAISLAGRTLVYLPSAREAGVSRRVADPVERERLRALLESLPGGGSFIARTAALGKSAEELSADHRYLTELAARIARRRESASAPALLHRELDLALRGARDLVSDDCDAIRVDDEATLARMKELLDAVAPRLSRRLELYAGPEPLFERFGVEAEIENALKSRVALPSGGSIVLHQTEALVAIDVNTGRFVGQEGARGDRLRPNLEAAPEVARQIRLRDLGGLVVVDFIDMEDPGHRQIALRALRGGDGAGPGAHAAPAGLRVRADRDHPAALARQPRARADPRLPGLLGQRARQDRPDRRARPPAAASVAPPRSFRRARRFACGYARAWPACSPRRTRGFSRRSRRVSASGSSSLADEALGGRGVRDRAELKVFPVQ